MKRSFGVQKFKALVVAGSFTVIADYVSKLTDSVVAGNMIGSDALAGVNLVAPVLSAIAFLSGLVATGMATNYSISMGRMQPRRAWEFFAQALWSVVIVGGALALAILFGRGAFLGFMGASVGVTACANEYLVWIWPVAILKCLEGMMVAIGYADGDSKLCVTAYVVMFVAKLVVSLVSVHLGMGAGGCALGSVVAEAVGVGVMVIHLFRKCNTVKLVRHFSVRDSGLIVRASFGDAAAFLCDALLFMFVNKFLIVTFGSDILPIAAVAAVLWGFICIFNGIGIALQPIVTVYYGEGNGLSIRRVMNYAMWLSVAEGVVMMLLFGCFPDLVVRLVGIIDPDFVVRSADFAVREMCFGFIALAIAGLFNSYYMFIERSGLAVVVTFLCYLVMPVAALVLCSRLGVHWVWIGMCLGPTLGVAVVAAVLAVVCEKGAFPLLLSRRNEAKLHVFDLELTDEEIVKTSQKVGNLEGVPVRAALMTEEVLMVVKERARGRKLLGEVTVDLNDGVILTIRDDGEIFDITDADAEISSLRTFLVASVMEQQKNRFNFITTGFNRNVFRF